MTNATQNNVTAILQARMSSSRLPGKVLLPILDKPMLQHQIERIQRSRYIDLLVVATSRNTEDDAIEKLCLQIGIPCFRGSLDDVLDRYYQASQVYPSTHIVRLTGDCPVADPEIIDAVIEQHLNKQADYTANCIHPTLPDGLDVEVFTSAALAKAWKQAQRPSEREHVTLYIRNHPEQFKLCDYYLAEDHSGLRWTVDNPEDFELISKFYKQLYRKKPGFTLADMLGLLAEQPELKRINQHIERNEGALKSFQKDKEAGNE